jgi:hypothetical protein
VTGVSCCSSGEEVLPCKAEQCPFPVDIFHKPSYEVIRNPP